MGISEVSYEAIDLQRQMSRAACERYQEAVVAVADSKLPSPEELFEVLRAAGKTADDLDKDVAALAEWRRLVATADEASEIQARRGEIATEIAEAQSRLDAAQAAFDEAVTPLKIESQNLERRLSAAHSARQELFRTSRNRGELAEIDRKISALQGKQRNADSQETLADLKARREELLTRVFFQV